MEQQSAREGADSEGGVSAVGLKGRAQGEACPSPRPGLTLLIFGAEIKRQFMVQVRSLYLSNPIQYTSLNVWP